MKQLSIFLSGAGKLSKRFFDKIARTIYRPEPTIKDIACNDFYNAGGEQLRFDYKDIDHESLVFDLGGYEGQWASDIYGRFRPQIYIFEVYMPYYNHIKERFSHNGDIKVYNYGLSAKNTTAQISIEDVATSAFKKSDNMVEIELKNASDFILENKIKKIDLMKINIEGGEYELLGYLIDSEIVKCIKNLQIQFHDFVPDAFNEMNAIRERLSKTHYPTFKFDFIWDNWRLKE